MSTLHQQSFLFNSKLTVSNTGGTLSSDGGILLVREFLDQIDFDQLLQQQLNFHDDRKYCTYEQVQLFKQLLFQLIAGYQQDSAADTLNKDAIFHLSLDQLVASQPTLSRFINRVKEENLQSVHQLIEQLGEFLIIQRNLRQLVIDIDSTHSDTFGRQEKTDYNAHYQTNGYHPLLAFEQNSGVLLGAALRPGNFYTSNGAEEFLAPILQRYHEKEYDMIVRGDSGFAKPEIYQLCEHYQTKFVVRLKSNSKLKTIAEHQILYSDKTDFTKEEIQWFSIDNYQPKTWDRPYRVIIKSTRAAGEFLFRHEFIVTNLTELFPKQLFPMYQNRGAMEGHIKEIKNGFFFDKTDSSSFTGNAFRMLLSGVAYNIIQNMKMRVFPEKQQASTISTIRFQLFHIAARVVSHARMISVQLSSTNVFDAFFWEVLRRIHSLKLYSETG
ncbi:IS1380 family transposase [Enterococcus sp.]|uniref:IS1380 family transposase n=1 Tax=Enterococcus sp. TaxID=35783 RepID=UPI0039957EE1